MSNGLIDFLNKFLAIINMGVGRDKSCRIIQYFIMMIAPMLQAKGAHYQDLLQRLLKLKSNMSMTRKVLRFGKEIPLITGIHARLAAHEKAPQRMVFWRTINDIALTLYFFTDHPLYFHNVGFVKYTKAYLDKIDYINNVFWLLNCIFDILCTLVDVKHLQNEIRELKVQMKENKNQGEQRQALNQKMKEKRAAYIKACLNVARNAFDIPAVFYFMGNSNVSQTAAGGCGVITSCISLYGLWGQK